MKDPSEDVAFSPFQYEQLRGQNAICYLLHPSLPLAVSRFSKEMLQFLLDKLARLGFMALSKLLRSVCELRFWVICLKIRA